MSAASVPELRHYLKQAHPLQKNSEITNNRIYFKISYQINPSVTR